MKLILIARASTQEQSQSLKIQVETLMSWCKLFDHEAVEILTSLESGKLAHRDDVEKALALIGEGKAEGIAITKLDRLGRNLQELCRIVKALDEMKAGLVAVQESIDTSSPQGRVVFHIMGAIAEFERELIVGRVTQGVHEAAKAGKRIGSPKFGFTVNEDGFPVPIPQEQDAISFMKDLKLTGLTYQQIAEQLNDSQLCPPKRGGLWTYSKVRDILAA
jgi:DNA invertase Pin-like site-specific DNA recombinase